MLNDLFASMRQGFGIQRLELAGHVQVKKGNINGSDFVDVIRKVNSGEIVTYKGGVLLFYLIDNLTVSQSRSLKGDARVVLITERYDDYVEFISHLDDYEYKNFEMSLQSQSIYESYFTEDDDKPFVEYAFEFTLPIVESLDFCGDCWVRE